MDQKQYLVAAQASEVYLDPMGGLLLEGLGRYRQYYRQGLQDKLGVDVHLFKVGEYKSAAEPYVLDAASPEAKEADLYWMNDVWQRYLADIAKARKLDAAQLAQGIEQLPSGIQSQPTAPSSPSNRAPRLKSPLEIWRGVPPSAGTMKRWRNPGSI